MKTPVAYIQSGSCEEFLSLSCKLVAKNLELLGYRVVPFRRDRLPKNVNPTTPIKGDTGVVKALYEYAFQTPYPNVDIPAPLKRFARRKVWTTTLGELRAQARNDWVPSIFVKPALEPKGFRAGRFHHLIREELALFPDDYPILAQDFRRFGRETRFFVGPRGPKLCPSERTNPELSEFAGKIYRAWKPFAPKAYVLDVGMSCGPDDRRELPTLVEINSILTAGKFSGVRNPGTLLVEAWKSYAHYAEHGTFR